MIRFGSDIFQQVHISCWLATLTVARFGYPALASSKNRQKRRGVGATDWSRREGNISM
jgi:hypothetical protein